MKSRFKRRNSAIFRRVECLLYTVTEKSPSVIFHDNGSIVFRDQRKLYHSITGPARTDIDGNIEYWLNGNKVDMFTMIIDNCYDN